MSDDYSEFFLEISSSSKDFLFSIWFEDIENGINPALAPIGEPYE